MMENGFTKRSRKRLRRAARVRKRLRGSATQPRLTVHKSHRHIAVQLIDDDLGVTVAAAGTQMKSLGSGKLGKNKAAAQLVGSRIAELAKEKNISAVVFDRGCHKYHGVIATLAQAAREAGLQF